MFSTSLDCPDVYTNSVLYIPTLLWRDEKYSNIRHWFLHLMDHFCSGLGIEINKTKKNPVSNYSKISISETNNKNEFGSGISEISKPQNETVTKKDVRAFTDSLQKFCYKYVESVNKAGPCAYNEENFLSTFNAFSYLYNSMYEPEIPKNINEMLSKFNTECEEKFEDEDSSENEELEEEEEAEDIENEPNQVGEEAIESEVIEIPNESKNSNEKEAQESPKVSKTVEFEKLPVLVRILICNTLKSKSTPTRININVARKMEKKIFEDLSLSKISPLYYSRLILKNLYTMKGYRMVHLWNNLRRSLKEFPNVQPTLLYSNFDYIDSSGNLRRMYFDNPNIELYVNMYNFVSVLFAKLSLIYENIYDKYVKLNIVLNKYMENIDTTSVDSFFNDICGYPRQLFFEIIKDQILSTLDIIEYIEWLIISLQHKVNSLRSIKIVGRIDGISIKWSKTQTDSEKHWNIFISVSPKSSFFVKIQTTKPSAMNGFMKNFHAPFFSRNTEKYENENENDEVSQDYELDAEKSDNDDINEVNEFEKQSNEPSYEEDPSSFCRIYEYKIDNRDLEMVNDLNSREASPSATESKKYVMKEKKINTVTVTALQTKRKKSKEESDYQPKRNKTNTNFASESNTENEWSDDIDPCIYDLLTSCSDGEINTITSSLNLIEFGCEKAWIYPQTHNLAYCEFCHLSMNPAITRSHNGKNVSRVGVNGSSIYSEKNPSTASLFYRNMSSQKKLSGIENFMDFLLTSIPPFMQSGYLHVLGQNLAAIRSEVRAFNYYFISLGKMFSLSSEIRKSSYSQKMDSPIYISKVVEKCRSCSLDMEYFASYMLHASSIYDSCFNFIQDNINSFPRIRIVQLNSHPLSNQNPNNTSTNNSDTGNGTSKTLGILDSISQKVLSRVVQLDTFKSDSFSFECFSLKEKGFLQTILDIKRYGLRVIAFNHPNPIEDALLRLFTVLSLDSKKKLALIEILENELDNYVLKLNTLVIKETQKTESYTNFVKSLNKTRKMFPKADTSLVSSITESTENIVQTRNHNKSKVNYMHNLSFDGGNEFEESLFMKSTQDWSSVFNQGEDEEEKNENTLTDEIDSESISSHTNAQSTLKSLIFQDENLEFESENNNDEATNVNLNESLRNNIMEIIHISKNASSQKNISPYAINNRWEALNSDSLLFSRYKFERMYQNLSENQWYTSNENRLQNQQKNKSNVPTNVFSRSNLFYTSAQHVSSKKELSIFPSSNVVLVKQNDRGNIIEHIRTIVLKINSRSYDERLSLMNYLKYYQLNALIVADFVVNRTKILYSCIPQKKSSKESDIDAKLEMCGFYELTQNQK